MRILNLGYSKNKSARGYWYTCEISRMRILKMRKTIFLSELSENNDLLGSSNR